jgi:hypothetical protein
MTVSRVSSIGREPWPTSGQETRAQTSEGTAITSETGRQSIGLKSEDGGSNPSPATTFGAFAFRWAEPLGRPECPFVRRWTIALFGYAIRLHYWTGSDDDRYFHDHAWDFISIILRGRYAEVTPTGTVIRTAGSVRRYKAEHQHMVRLIDRQPCWSLVLSAPMRRKFGFIVNGHVMRPLRYFSRYGLHPCD